MTSTRREVLRTGWKIGGTFLTVAAGWTVFESLRPLGAGSKGAVLDLGDPANYPTNTATYVTEGRLFVANAGGHVFALSQKCPHLGCRVPFCDSSGRFECPCHGSKFDLGGEWIEGPAPRGMDRYDLRLENGALVVDTSKLAAGPDRGADQFQTPPKGPACQ
jgi:Rieske Fe-S protein